MIVSRGWCMVQDLEEVPVDEELKEAALRPVTTADRNLDGETAVA